MGNDTSHVNSLNIEEKAVETIDFWLHFHATISNGCNFFSLKSDGSVSLFKGIPVSGPLWSSSTPLEKCTNNLLKYRHPHIVRYISSWQQKSVFHLITEYVQPLSQVLAQQTPLQICIGLNNILQALVFLHEQGGISHNNVSISSIYVSGDGQWKLGGLQYLCTFNELNITYLKQARLHRYDKGVDPNEDSYEITTKVDQYSFAVLVEDVFKGRANGDVPHLIEFKKYCRECLQDSEPEKRPNLSEILNHDFFNHEFITIYKFLINLPLKTEDEKCLFFSNILINLNNYDEETVAKQLGGLLLSRHSLLDQTARRHVIPFILRPKNERLQNGEPTGYFTSSIFKEHLKPRVLQLFGVRDSQVRMLLLSHFSKFVHMFSHEELSQQILPELLLGIKDTNDTLVATTLMCLSDLVPILGADTVVGGKRSKIFIDGRPHNKSNVHSLIPSKSLQDLESSQVLFQHGFTNKLDETIILNERPSPVGGESNEESLTKIEPGENNNVLYSEDDWDEWDNSKRILQINHTDIDNEEITQTDVHNAASEKQTELNSDHDSPLIRSTLLQTAAMNAKRKIMDISELDIKNSKVDSSRKKDEIDFFADMIPVIEKQEVALVTDKLTDYSSKLNFVPDENVEENEGWDDNWNE